MSTNSRPLDDESDDLAEQIEALQRSIEWRRTALLVQTLRKLNAWRDQTRSDANARITQLETTQAAEQKELRMLEAQQRLQRAVLETRRDVQPQSGNADGAMAPVFELYSDGGGRRRASDQPDAEAFS